MCVFYRKCAFHFFIVFYCMGVYCKRICLCTLREKHIVKNASVFQPKWKKFWKSFFCPSCSMHFSALRSWQSNRHISASRSYLGCSSRESLKSVVVGASNPVWNFPLKKHENKFVPQHPVVLLLLRKIVQQGGMIL